MKNGEALLNQAVCDLQGLNVCVNCVMHPLTGVKGPFMKINGGNEIIS